MCVCVLVHVEKKRGRREGEEEKREREREKKKRERSSRLRRGASKCTQKFVLEQESSEHEGVGEFICNKPLIECIEFV